MKHKRGHIVSQYIISTAVLLIAGWAVFFPENILGIQILDYNVHLMIGMFLIGFGALTINYTKVMVTSLGACMLLCIFLKNESNEAMIMPIANTEAKLSVAHFNVSNVQDLDNLINTIDDLDVDLLSFQELTPDWNYILQEKLKTQYPYNMSIVRIDPYGMAMYSKENFVSIDTFMFDNKPNLQADLLIDSKKISVFGTYLVPEITKASTVQTKKHLDMISYKIRDTQSPVIALGDYNMVYLANAISRFRAKAQVIHSLRDVYEDGLKPPYDHIFFTTDMECTKFENINDLKEKHIGILGAYQIKTKYIIDKSLPTTLSSLSI